MTENEVEKDIIVWMQDRKWRRQRNHVGLFTDLSGNRIRIGVAGFPDWSFRRSVSAGRVEICHVETKTPGKKPSQVQKEQLVLLNYLGEPAWYADSLDMHVQKYSEVF